ncbi:MAG: hypothetical protein KKA55_14085 [Proteobacteria bacterium]|nr:hypothetical protein [Pseudomonadota bacterium]MBU1596650.1 hypothetical protein [Pseudomonadota bacterium]
MSKKLGISVEQEQAASHTAVLSREYLRALQFISFDTSRDPEFRRTHLFSYLFQDYLQSSLSIAALIKDGLINVARRELRFLLEASVKICYIQQSNYTSTIDEKLSEFESVLGPASITMKRKLALDLLPEEEKLLFRDEIGRLYGDASHYVHLSQQQISERIAFTEQGRTVGYESGDDINFLNSIVARVFAASLVLLFHATPAHVAGDFFVESDGKIIDWYFTKSRFIACIDSAFDYKFERQKSLEAIRATRASRIEF